MMAAKVALAAKALLLRERMTSSPHSIGRDQTLRVAHQMMHQHSIRHLPVLDGGKLVGIVSQRDLYFLESVDGVDLAVDKVESAMTQDVYCVPSSSSLRDVVNEMVARSYGCVVAVDGGKVVGVFTTTDALRVLGEFLR
jgi:acetoin utilization protein AcuB